VNCEFQKIRPSGLLNLLGSHQVERDLALAVPMVPGPFDKGSKEKKGEDLESRSDLACSIAARSKHNVQTLQEKINL